MAVSNPEWRIPVRLATSGTLAKLWKSKGQARGNGVAISLLPILALHVAPKDGKTWTGWNRIPYRDFAELAGVHHNSVRSAIARLQAAGLLQRRSRWRKGKSLTYMGSRRAKRIVFYRLNAKEVHPQQDEPWATLPATLFEAGIWARLTPAARSVYLVQRCLKARPDGFSFAELEELSGLSRSTLERALKLVEKKAAQTVVSRPPRGRPRKAENNQS